MTKTFTTYQISRNLKDIGFDKCSFGYYLHEKFNYFHNTSINDRKNSVHIKEQLYPTDCTAVLWQQATDWLREEHNIHVWVTPLSLTDYEYHYFKDGGWTFTKNGHESYHKALEEGILQGLSLLNNEK